MHTLSATDQDLDLNILKSQKPAGLVVGLRKRMDDIYIDHPQNKTQGLMTMKT